MEQEKNKEAFAFDEYVKARISLVVVCVVVGTLCLPVLAAILGFSLRIFHACLGK